MNISLNQKSATEGQITVKIEEQDYLPKVNNKIRDYAKKANIKGFRQGMVPNGVVKKMFGKSILVEEVNHVISHAITDFIKEKKLKVLGDPMPDSEKARTIDWDTQKDFEFLFHVGMAADFKVELSPKVKIQKYNIEIDQKILDETIAETRKRYATSTAPELSEASDILYGENLLATDDKQKHCYIVINKAKTAEQKKFVGVKKDDVIEFNAKQAFENVADQANALGSHEGDLESMDGNAKVKITHVSRLIDAELNQDTFDKVFGKDAVKSMDEFVAKVKETIAQNYDRETNHMLDHEIEHHLSDHIKIELPEEFLKNWLKQSSETITDEILNKEFNDYKNSIKLDLIKNQIAEENKIQVDGNEVKEKARQMVIDQFGGAAVAEQLKDRIDQIADNYLKGNEGQNFMKLYNALRTEKIMSHIKSVITVTEKKVTLDEFKKVVEEHRH